MGFYGSEDEESMSDQSSSSDNNLDDLEAKIQERLAVRYGKSGSSMRVPIPRQLMHFKNMEGQDS
jgi:hypothetical protein